MQHNIGHCRSDKKLKCATGESSNLILARQRLVQIFLKIFNQGDRGTCHAKDDSSNFFSSHIRVWGHWIGFMSGFGNWRLPNGSGKRDQVEYWTFSPSQVVSSTMDSSIFRYDDIYKLTPLDSEKRWRDSLQIAKAWQLYMQMIFSLTWFDNLPTVNRICCKMTTLHRSIGRTLSWIWWEVNEMMYSARFQRNELVTNSDMSWQIKGFEYSWLVNFSQDAGARSPGCASEIVHLSILTSGSKICIVEIIPWILWLSLPHLISDADIANLKKTTLQTNFRLRKCNITLYYVSGT